MVSRSYRPTTLAPPGARYRARRTALTLGAAHIEPSDLVRLSFARGAVSVKLEVHDMDLGFAS